MMNLQGDEECIPAALLFLLEFKKHEPDSLFIADTFRRLTHPLHLSIRNAR